MVFDRSPVDVEGHRGSDGRFYLIDYSRVMPPETPLKGYLFISIFKMIEFLVSFFKKNHFIFRLKSAWLYRLLRVKIIASF